MDYCNEDSCDWDWDYCSLDEDHTRYNYKCTEKCEKKGTSYYWCNKEGGSWDYCSPSAKLGVHKSDHVELTRYGVKCRDVCGLKGENYYWCTQHGGDYNNWWDYCSPEYTPGGFQGHETVTSTKLLTALIIGAVFVGAFMLCIVGIVCLKRVSGA